MAKKLSIIAVFVIVLVVLNAPASMGGDAFLLIGYKQFRGDIPSDFNTFILSGGSDYRIVPYLGLGFEVQYSYKKIEDFTFNWLNLYINAKAFASSGRIRPFVGAGIGLQTATAWVGEFEDTEFTKEVGYQVVGGVSFRPGAGEGGVSDVGVMLQVQAQLPKDLDGVTAVHFMVGITW